MTESTGIDSVIAEQIAYYRDIAKEYEHHAIPGYDAGELVQALEDHHPYGDVLEITCGIGLWTERLLRHATSVTAVDAAPEMIARAKARVGADSARFIQADLFEWRPDRRFDFVFFGF